MHNLQRGDFPRRRVVGNCRAGGRRPRPAWCWQPGLVSRVSSVLRQKAPRPAVVEPPLQLTDFNDSAIQPAVSPDGRMVTFIRGGFFGTPGRAGNLRQDPAARRAGPAHAGPVPKKEQPVFSPDGSRIIYAAVSPGLNGTRGRCLYLGGAPQPFLPNAWGLVRFAISASCIPRSWRRHPHGHRDVDGESHGSQADLLPAARRRHGASLGPFPDGSRVLVVEMNGGEWLPCRLVPFDGSSTGHPIGPLDWPVHDRRMVAGRPMDVFLARTPAGAFTSGVSDIPTGRPSRSRPGRPNRRDRGHTRWQVPHHEHGSPTGEHLVAGASICSPAYLGRLCDVADDGAVGRFACST